MLTADLVRAKRQGSELRLLGMAAPLRARATDLAGLILEAFTFHLGHPREELDEALAAIEAGVREQRVKDGLVKLALDRSRFGGGDELDAATLRREVFTRAAAARRDLAGPLTLDRERIFADAAKALGAMPESVEKGLFSDLKGAQMLEAFEPTSAATLVESYERGQAAAVLLRATRVVLTVSCSSAGATRALFRRLKFLQLLYAVTPTSEGHQITIDGPLSLFDAATRYGQKLSQLPSLLDACEAWKLEANLRWGKERTPLIFKLEGTGEAGTSAEEPPLPDDVQALARGWERLGAKWRVTPSRAILNLPGQGLCVPDLVFSRGTEKIYLEVLGYWSRDAVFRRIELVERGLPERILFAVSSRLRVSEELLDESPSAALYVYKGTMSARAVADRLDALAAGRKKGS